MIDTRKVLKELSKKRPIFHSEADFQHALAWEIHKKYPDLNIRLEKREKVNGEEIYPDIFTFKDGKIVVVEVKYKTRELNITLSSEEFNLKNQSAQDCGRYDFLKDISKLEKLLEKYPDAIGFAYSLQMMSLIGRNLHGITQQIKILGFTKEELLQVG